MATPREGDTKAFADYLKDAPSFDELSSGATTELTGVVSRSGDGRFGITTADGQTYELDVAAVRRFRAEEGQGFARVATIEVPADAFKAASVRQIKPAFKELAKDPIKDIIKDSKQLPKDMIKDPIKDVPKDVPTKELAKDGIKDPIKEMPKEMIKDLPKDVGKDPIFEGINTGFADNVGTGVETNLPIDQLGNLRAAGGVTPFVMSTPHQAPAHLLALQAGAGAAANQTQFKPFASDPNTIKELALSETLKEPVTDTIKEMVRDTVKEITWDTWVEGWPYTLVENVGFDPGQLRQPVGFGLPGFM